MAFCTTAHAVRECERPEFVPTEGACARLANAELFYYDSGPAKGVRAETVVLLHANSGNADAFKRNFDVMRRAGYRVVAFDRKNFARSSNTVRDDAIGRSRSTALEDLDALMAYLGIARFHLIGIAAGGQMAIQYAASAASPKVSSLVLAATLGPPGLSANEPALSAVEANIALPFEVFCSGMVSNPPPAPLRLIAPGASATVIIPEVLLEHKELGSQFRGADRAGVEDYARISANARQASSDGCRSTNVGANQPGLAANDPANPNTFAKLLALVKAPTLLVAGTGDVFYAPPVHMSTWGPYIANAKFVQLDTGHAPQFEDPGRFNELVLKFLAAQPR